MESSFMAKIPSFHLRSESWGYLLAKAVALVNGKIRVLESRKGRGKRDSQL